MVRLKGRIACHVIDRAVISIPYGSIKSRDRDSRLQRPEYLFQFLMVRLKGGNCLTSNSGYHISIPYGSIKS